MNKARKPRPGGESLAAEHASAVERREAVARTVGRARVAFRDVTRATDSRTVRACLVPPEHFLTNKAPYLAFVDDEPEAEAACLGLMNSLAFDWQARRFVETNLNFFILEGFRLPELDDDHLSTRSPSALAPPLVPRRALRRLRRGDGRRGAARSTTRSASGSGPRSTRSSPTRGISTTATST